MESSYTEIENASCRYCDGPTEMIMVSQKEITPELMEQRIKDLSNNMLSNLQSAYLNMTENEKINSTDGPDVEKEMLLLLAKVKKLQESIQGLGINKPAAENEL